MREMHILGRPVSCGAVALILAVVLCTFPVWWPKIDVLIHQIGWSRFGIDDYTMSVTPIGYGFGQQLTGGREIVVLDGNIISVSENSGCPNCPPENPDRFQTFTIDGLFNWAFACVLGCIIEYDPTYGYPVRVGAYFIEGGWVVISNFQPQISNR